MVLLGILAWTRFSAVVMNLAMFVRVALAFCDCDVLYVKCVAWCTF